MIAGLIALVLIVATLLHCELSNKNSRTNNWLWCRKHGLKLKERVGPECAILWSGEDGDGNEYVPGENGEPVLIKKEATMQTNNKLREACANIAEYARSAMCHATDTHVLGYLNQIEGWAKAALAAPPRNCDVGTPEEQKKRFDWFCMKYEEDHLPGEEGGCVDTCPCIGEGRIVCGLRWAQLPYESEAGK